MEYASGGELFEYIVKRKKLKEQEAVRFFQQIISGIEYIHRSGICHRDLKPDNVVFDEDGHALLTDFGLSKTGMGASSVSNSFCGSVAYLAPEMLRRAGHTKSIDWYLLGVLIYEMLVGVPPYFNPDKAILFKNIE